jgi:two-component system, cell cycle response regulator CtrA
LAGSARRGERPRGSAPGLGFGADEFLTKPFDRRELIGRIKAIVRRSKGHPESLIRTGNLAVNLDTRVVTVEDKPVHLTGKDIR